MKDLEDFPIQKSGQTAYQVRLDIVIDEHLVAFFRHLTAERNDGRLAEIHREPKIPN